MIMLSRNITKIFDVTNYFEWILVALVILIFIVIVFVFFSLWIQNSEMKLLFRYIKEKMHKK